jgi:quercetin dioxygenase-like cupin family protein
MNMKHSVWLLVFAAIITLPGVTYPQAPTPVSLPVRPAELKWMPAIALPKGVQFVVIYGVPTKPGLSIILLKFPPNFRVPPHAHPVQSIVTVLSGTYYSGEGDKFDPDKLRMFPAGSVLSEPVNAPHFAQTREDEVILQVTLVEPSATQYVDPADDPRKR